MIGPIFVHSIAWAIKDLCYIPAEKWSGHLGLPTSYKQLFSLLLPRCPGMEEGMSFLTYLLRGLCPQANYIDRATAACRRS
jgi:hypothetical protein